MTNLYYLFFLLVLWLKINLYQKREMSDPFVLPLLSFLNLSIMARLFEIQGHFQKQELMKEV